MSPETPERVRAQDVLLHGRTPAPARPIVLRAGPVTALLDGPDLRHVRVGGTELVQRVYIAVRDAPWNTIPAQYGDWIHDIGDDRFEVRFEARHRHEAIDFAWTGRIAGTPDGRITYEMDGVCHAVFAYSKIGVNVHHDLPGSVDRPYHARNGARTWTGRLPVAIDPQRVVDGTLSGMFDPYEELAIEVANGLEAVIALEGDLLELQDHRNWTDANFKSYGTPLALGFPFESVAGQRIRQVLSIGYRGTPPAREDPRPSVAVGPTLEHRMPAIGLGMASDGTPLGPSETQMIAALSPAHLRVDLPLRDDAWRSPLDRASADARAVGAALELALHLPADAAADLERLAGQLAGAGVPVARALVYPLADGFSAIASTTPPELVALVREVLGPVTGPIVVAGGTDQSFADINRARPTDPAMTGLCFSVCPTVHAADDASIIENLAGQSEVVRFAREIAAPRSIHVSPVTLATRFGPYPNGPARPGDLPPAVDPRQLSLLGAAWTAASIGELARAGATSATYYETAGWRGVMERATGSPMPERFPSGRGQAFPLYHPLADALDAAGGTVRDLRSSDPLRLGGFAVATDGGVLVVLANLTPDDLTAAITGLPSGRARIRTLDASSGPLAMADPTAFRAATSTTSIGDAPLELRFGPYASVRLDAGGSDGAR